MHEEGSSFVTLTYADEHLPLARDEETDLWHPTLVKKDLTRYVKALRKHFPPGRVRYFGSGEYGSKGGRPHYHLIFFGLDASHQEVFDKTWGKGHTSTYIANPATFAYVAKYLLKGSADGEPSRDSSLPPREQRVTERPWRIMSLRPPIGAAFAESIGHSLTSRVGAHVLASAGVKPLIRTEVGKYPLDRTMKKYAGSVLELPEEMAKAVFRGQHIVPTPVQTQNAVDAHERALRVRHKRTKL